MARGWRGPVVAAVIAAASLGGALPARAEDGLDLKGAVRYVVPGDASPVSVTHEVTATNRLAPRGATVYYWDTISIWLPTKVTDLAARTGERPLTVRRITQDEFSYAQVQLPRRLLHGQSQTVTLTYRIPGSPPRSPDPARVGPRFAAFDVFSEGDSGRARIEIVAPRGMDLDLGLPHTERASGGARIATITGGGPTGLWTRMSLRDTTRKVTERIQVAGKAFTFEGWPGDTRWLAFQTSTVPKAVPVLQELTGQTWPHGQVTITEDASGSVYGWDGSYRGGQIAVDERLDVGLLTHELAHAWANSATLGQRWLAEGLAQVLATTATARLGGTDEPHAVVDPDDAAAFPLNDWDDPTGRAANSADDYGYPASWRATRALVDGATAANLPEIVSRLTQRRTAYDGPADRAWPDGSDWRQAYDLFELYAANPDTEDIMRSWVLTDAEAGELTDRAGARRAYAALDRADGPGLPPLRVRTPMARWDFAHARETITATTSLATALAGAQQEAVDAGLTLGAARAAYEKATSASEYAALERLLAETRTAVAGFRAERAAQRDPAGALERIGRRVRPGTGSLAAAAGDIDQGRPDQALQTLATLRSDRDRARLAGVAVIAVAAIAVGAIALGLIRSRRRKRAALSRR